MHTASLVLRAVLMIVALVAFIAVARASGEALSAMPRFDLASGGWWREALGLALIGSLPPALFVAAQWPRLWWLPALLALLLLSITLYVEPEMRGRVRDFLGL